MPAGGDLIGKTLGKCKILGRLGHGKTSTIFRAHYATLGKEVAVKVLKEDMRANAEIHEKFLNEARALARLDHPNIVKVFDVAEADGNLLIIMELLPGADLYRLLGERGPFEAAQAVAIVREAAEALQAAHRQGIVHRDVKPQNLMLVGRREQVKLVDFGLATEGALIGGKAGTPHYMSPEQIQGRKVDEKSDIYSLGATLFHLLTGQPPYPGKTREEIVEKHLAGKLPSVSRTNRELEVPPALDPIVKRMMAPVPGYRYGAADLIAALDGLNLEARRRGRHTHSAKAAVRRATNQPLLIAAAIGVVGLIVTLVVLLMSRGGGPPAQPIGPAPAPAPRPGPVAPSIQDRGENREERERRSGQAFSRAQSFEANNTGKRDLILAEYKKVFDEYPDTGAGGKARDRMREIERQIDAEKRAAEEAAKAGTRKEKKAALDETLKKSLAAYDFATARKAMESFLFDFHDKELERTMRRLKYAEHFIKELAGGINENQKKYNLSLFKPGAPSAAVIEAADEKGVKIKDGTLERHEPWSFFTPQELSKMGTRQLGTREPLNLCYLGMFLIVTGNASEGDDMIQQARVFDELGKVQQILDEVETGR